VLSPTTVLLSVKPSTDYYSLFFLFIKKTRNLSANIKQADKFVVHPLTNNEPMASYRSRKKFLHSFFILFLAYLFIAPAVYIIFDFESAVKVVKRDLGSFIVKMTAIAIFISFVIALWWRKDPALRGG
jgi:hypothetical protein